MRGALSFLATAALVTLTTLTTACSTASLDPEGERVTASPNPPAASCEMVGRFTGEGGGTLGGAWISNDSLIEYATNDLRNQAGEAGANYVQTDPPSLGDGDGTTTTATITGTAFFCP